MARRDASSRTGVSVSEAAEQLGVHRNTMLGWFRKGAPRNEDGSVNVDLVHEWRAIIDEENAPDYDTSAKDTVRMSKRADNEELRKWTLEYRKMKALREAVALKRERGDIIDMSEHKRICAARMASFRRRLMPIGRRLAPELVGLTQLEMQLRIEQEIVLMLRDIAETGRIEETETSDLAG